MEKYKFMGILVETLLLNYNKNEAKQKFIEVTQKELMRGLYAIKRDDDIFMEIKTQDVEMNEVLNYITENSSKYNQPLSEILGYFFDNFIKSQVGKIASV